MKDIWGMGPQPLGNYVNGTHQLDVTEWLAAQERWYRWKLERAAASKATGEK